MNWNNQAPQQGGWGQPAAPAPQQQGGWGQPAAPAPQQQGGAQDFTSLLGGKSTPSASFKGQFPIAWGGTVEEVTQNPAYDYDPSKPNNRGAQKFWPDGNPVMNVWVTIQTDVRDPSIQYDDGRRVLVLDSKNKLDAVQQAVRESGGSFVQGGRLDIEWYGNDTVNAKNPDNPPKLYRARYQPPSLDGMLNVGPSTPAASAPPAQQGGWGGQAQPASPAPATGGWGQQPNTAAAGWGAPAQAQPPVPQPLPADMNEAMNALRRKGIDPATITSQEQAEQLWAVAQFQPDVA